MVEAEEGRRLEFRKELRQALDGRKELLNDYEIIAKVVMAAAKKVLTGYRGRSTGGKGGAAPLPTFMSLKSYFLHTTRSSNS